MNLVAETLSTQSYVASNKNIAGVGNLMMTISRPDSNLLELIRSENKNHPKLVRLHSLLKEGNLPIGEYTNNQRILFYKGRMTITADSTFRTIIIQEFIDSPLGGHVGVHMTFMRVLGSLVWPHMKKDIQKYVWECITCRQVKYSTQKPGGLLQPLPTPNKVFEQLTVDFGVSLTNSHDNYTILVAVDRLSNFAHFGALPHHYTASKVATLFINMVVKLHGIPKSISNRDPIFLCSFWQALSKESGTSLKFSSLYHP